MNKACKQCNKLFNRPKGRSGKQWSKQIYCGRKCLNDSNITHGMSHSRFWYIWSHMKSRCLNENDIFYKNYGGRGITVCRKWLKFENFLEDMKEGYSDVLTIDRIDVNGDYCKENCRWATKIQQARNARSNIVLELKGQKVTITELSEKTGIKYHTLYNRIYIHGLTPEQSISVKSFAHGRVKAKDFIAKLLTHE